MRPSAPGLLWLNVAVSRISAFFKVTFHSVHLYGRGTLCWGGLINSSQGHIPFCASLWKRGALLRGTHKFLTRSHSILCISMEEGRSVVGDSYIPHKVTFNSVHLYGRGVLCCGELINSSHLGGRTFTVTLPQISRSKVWSRRMRRREL